MHQCDPSIAQIAKRLGWPCTTIHDTIQRYTKFQTCYNSPRPGRSQLASPHKTRLIVRKITSNPFKPWTFIDERHSLSDGTIRRIAHRYGYYKRVACHKPCSSQKARKARTLWAKENKYEDWTRVLQTNEASFMRGSFYDQRTLEIRKAYKAYQLRDIIPTLRSERKSIMAWGCIGSNRKFELHFFDKGSCQP